MSEPSSMIQLSMVGRSMAPTEEQLSSELSAALTALSAPGALAPSSSAAASTTATASGSGSSAVTCMSERDKINALTLLETEEKTWRGSRSLLLTHVPRDLLKALLIDSSREVCSLALKSISTAAFLHSQDREELFRRFFTRIVRHLDGKFALVYIEALRALTNLSRGSRSLAHDIVRDTRIFKAIAEGLRSSNQTVLGQTTMFLSTLAPYSELGSFFFTPIDTLACPSTIPTPIAGSGMSFSDAARVHVLHSRQYIDLVRRAIAPVAPALLAGPRVPSEATAEGVRAAIADGVSAVSRITTPPPGLVKQSIAATLAALLAPRFGPYIHYSVLTSILAGLTKGGWLPAVSRHRVWAVSLAPSKSLVNTTSGIAEIIEPDLLSVAAYVRDTYQSTLQRARGRQPLPTLPEGVTLPAPPRSSDGSSIAEATPEERVALATTALSVLPAQRQPLINGHAPDPSMYMPLPALPLLTALIGSATGGTGLCGAIGSQSAEVAIKACECACVLASHDPSLLTVASSPSPGTPLVSASNKPGTRTAAASTSTALPPTSLLACAISRLRAPAHAEELGSWALEQRQLQEALWSLIGIAMADAETAPKVAAEVFPAAMATLSVLPPTATRDGMVSAGGHAAVEATTPSHLRAPGMWGAALCVSLIAHYRLQQVVADLARFPSLTPAGAAIAAAAKNAAAVAGAAPEVVATYNAIEAGRIPVKIVMQFITPVYMLAVVTVISYDFRTAAGSTVPLSSAPAAPATFIGPPASGGPGAAPPVLAFCGAHLAPAIPTAPPTQTALSLQGRTFRLWHHSYTIACDIICNLCSMRPPPPSSLRDDTVADTYQTHVHSYGIKSLYSAFRRDFISPLPPAPSDAAAAGLSPSAAADLAASAASAAASAPMGPAPLPLVSVPAGGSTRNTAAATATVAGCAQQMTSLLMPEAFGFSSSDIAPIIEAALTSQAASAAAAAKFSELTGRPAPASAATVSLGRLVLEPDLPLMAPHAAACMVSVYVRKLTCDPSLFTADLVPAPDCAGNEGAPLMGSRAAILMALAMDCDTRAAAAYAMMKRLEHASAAAKAAQSAARQRENAAAAAATAARAAPTDPASKGKEEAALIEHAQAIAIKGAASKATVYVESAADRITNAIKEARRTQLHCVSIIAAHIMPFYGVSQQPPIAAALLRTQLPRLIEGALSFADSTLAPVLAPKRAAQLDALRKQKLQMQQQQLQMQQQQQLQQQQQQQQQAQGQDDAIEQQNKRARVH